MYRVNLLLYRTSFLCLGLLFMNSLFAQPETKKQIKETDSFTIDSIQFTTESASKYIQKILLKDNLWRPEGYAVKHSLERLLNHYTEPFDSVESRIKKFIYNPVEIKNQDIIKNDTLPLRWLNDSTFIVDTLTMEREPFIIKKVLIKSAEETSGIAENDSLTEAEAFIDSLFGNYIPIVEIYDTITETIIDTAYIESKGIILHNFVQNRIEPPLIVPGDHKSLRFLPDSVKLIISDTTKAIVAAPESPFYIIPNKSMPDSLLRAVETIISYTIKRDSILIYFNDIQGQRTPFWLTSGNDELYRYWVRNYKNDSITIWMGNPSKNDITMILEEDVNLNRLTKETAEHIPITLVRPQLSLAKVEPLKEIPVYWSYGFSSAFALNQTYLSFWSKGGENSFSTMIDIQGNAKYTGNDSKMQWNNSARLKYGSIITEETGLRTNTDMLEFNSQYNKVLKKKIDFSAIFYMKNQIAKGYKYPNDSVVVSRFLNPGTFTIGAGVEYKGFKNTSLNFSALSYKNTFVLDTANIDQTKHGIDADKRARQEMGGQLMIKNNTNITDNLKMTNAIRLFSGYLDEPQNIDVDWEINLDLRLNWYFNISLNLHMIYDDDIRFPVMDKNDEPVKLPDGSIKKSPKMQFKQFLGLTFALKF